MIDSAAVANKLRRLLEEECKLHEKYAEITEAERNSLTKFDSEKVAVLTEKRAALSEAIEKATVGRIEFMKAYPGGEELKVSEFIARFCRPDDARSLVPIIARLKESVTRSRTKSNELHQLVNFSLNIVNGTMSILWSATQNIVKVYGRTGTVKEAYNPKSRAAGVLKEA